VALFAPENTPPVADPNGPYTGNEGSLVDFDGSGSSDPDGDPLTYAWVFGDSNSGSGPTPNHTYADNGTYAVCLTVTDPYGLSDTACTTADISNVAPDVNIDSPIDGALFKVGVPVELSATFTDPGVQDTHTCSVDWDPDTTTGTVAESGGNGTCTDTYSYAAAGVYNIVVTLTDKDGDHDADTVMVVVYDPDAGFVTGGGWIDSLEGAYMPDPTLTGRATFGFVSKYRRGASVPTGNTEFVFHAGALNFHSTSYEFLVVNQGGSNAQFKGSGTINGDGSYKFMLWANDGDPDTFRIRIWEEVGETEVVIYDNGTNQPIGRGSIVVHTK
jgi:PKD repeat protein